jgi:hypothetical protein
VLAEVRVRPALPCVALRAVLSPGARESPVVEDLVDALRGSSGHGMRLTASGEDADGSSRERPRPH